MKIHLISETEFGVKSMGIHTAHIDLKNLLEDKKEVDVVVNQAGKGDIFHAHTYGLYYFFKGFRYKHRRVHTVHTIPETLEGSVPYYKLIAPFAKMYFRLVFNFADVCIALSPTVAESLKKLGVKSKIMIINNPISPEKWRFTKVHFESGRDLLGIENNKFVVLGVGQVQKRKGIEDFIDMAALLPNLSFVWVGGRPFGVLTEGIKRIDEKIKNASPNFKIIGPIDLSQMPLVYAAADVFVFPSYQENCPLAPIEAAATGLPVIFRDLKEYSKLYENNYLKANTTLDFTNLIRRLAVSEYFHKKGKVISENLIKQFEQDHIYSKIMHLYTTLNNQIIPKTLYSNSLQKLKKLKALIARKTATIKPAYV
jgi:1,2-diacylglycerol-3-alpha-glucose alpha-1,2-galactosyltransferase